MEGNLLWVALRFKVPKESLLMDPRYRLTPHIETSSTDSSRASSTTHGGTEKYSAFRPAERPASTSARSSVSSMGQWALVDVFRPAIHLGHADLGA